MGNSLRKVAPGSPPERGAVPERRLTRRHSERRQQARPETVRSGKNGPRSRSHARSASATLAFAAPLSVDGAGGGVLAGDGLAEWGKLGDFSTPMPFTPNGNTSFRRGNSKANIPIAAPVTPKGCPPHASMDGKRQAALPLPPGHSRHGIPPPSPGSGSGTRWHHSRSEATTPGQRPITPRIFAVQSPAACDAGNTDRGSRGSCTDGGERVALRDFSDLQRTLSGRRKVESQEKGSEPSYLKTENWAAVKSSLRDMSPRRSLRGSFRGEVPEESGSITRQDAKDRPQSRKNENDFRSLEVRSTSAREAEADGGRGNSSRDGAARVAGSQRSRDARDGAATPTRNGGSAAGQVASAASADVDPSPRGLRPMARGEKVKPKAGEKYGWLFSYPTPRLSSHYYPTGLLLGKGNFGEVEVFKSLHSGASVASKRIGKEKLTYVEDFEDVRREVAILRHLGGHPHVCELRGVFEDRESIHIVMGLCAGGALSSQILQRKMFPEGEAAHVFRQVVEAVRHTHAKGVMHRDLKPENIFLSANTDPERPTAVHVTLGDYGLAVFLRPWQLTSGIAGSPYYFAPEVVAGKEYGLEADIWSLGVILYVLISGMLPFYGNTDKEVFDKILTGKARMTGKQWTHVSLEAKGLILRMLSMDVQLRPSAEEILHHQWLSRN